MSESNDLDDIKSHEGQQAAVRSYRLAEATRDADTLRRRGALVAFAFSLVFGGLGICLAWRLVDGISSALTGGEDAANPSGTAVALVPWLSMSRAVVVGLVVAYGFALLRLAERLARPLFLPMNQTSREEDAWSSAVREVRALGAELMEAVRSIKKG